jgi:hypothetical protein
MISQEDQERIDEYRRISRSMIASHDAIHEQRAIRDAKRGLLGLIALVTVCGLLVAATYLITPADFEPPPRPSAAAPSR